MTQDNTNQYTVAGWLAIISAVMVMPEIALAVLSEYMFPAINLLIIPIHVANLAIGIYTLYMFRRLLNRQFTFHTADVLITIMIVVNVLFFFVGLVELYISLFRIGRGMEYGLSLVTAVLFVPFSLLTIAFGAVLLKMKDDLFGLLKPYAYTTITSGVCGATIILAPVGLLFGVIALVMMGMIFLRAKKEAEIL